MPVTYLPKNNRKKSSKFCSTFSRKIKCAGGGMNENCSRAELTDTIFLAIE
jgi:hypothetical protein